MIEHPAITQRQLKGIPEAKKVMCSVCGKWIGDGDDVFVDSYGNILGCEHCVQKKEAWEVYDE